MICSHCGENEATRTIEGLMEPNFCESCYDEYLASVAEDYLLPKCSKCGEPAYDPWPADGDEIQCQLCWEAECSAAWWDALPVMNAMEGV